MPNNISEDKFIMNILNNLEKKYFDTLVKLSCCQCYCDNDSDLISFLLKTNGKYYFDNSGNLPKR